MTEYDSAPYPRAHITGVVLAGGQGRRMGGVDKGLELLGTRPMAAYAVDALRQQCARVLVNANRNANDYAALGCDVFADQLEGFAGPLAGIASALTEVACGWVLFVPCDSPLVSRDLGPRLFTGMTAANADIAMAHDGERTHPVFALVSTQLAASARAALTEGERKIDRWYARHAVVEVALPDLAHTFVNVNRLEDKAAVAEQLGAAGVQHGA
ncbi:MAG: molybdenum cofactor guanylyltransferase MobA [Pseudomonadota bacterium]